MDSQRYQEDLAYIHHVGFTELARQATPAILATLREAGIHDGTVVELGCGTGVLLSALSAAGYRAVGVDASPAMLELASSTAPSATLLQGSFYDVALPPCRAILAVGEPFNYVTSPETVPPISRLLGHVETVLSPGGLLLFDAMVRGRALSKAYRSWQSGDDWACLVDVLPQSGSHTLRRAITSFRFVDKAYRRAFEEHWLYLFSRTLLIRQLKQAGFTVQTASAYGRVPLAPGRQLFHCIRAQEGPPSGSKFPAAQPGASRRKNNKALPPQRATKGAFDGSGLRNPGCRPAWPVGALRGGGTLRVGRAGRDRGTSAQDRASLRCPGP